MEHLPLDRELDAEAVAASGARTAPAIEISDLRKDYNGFLAVDGLNLTVPQGCFFGFLGPNGAGKTTTIRMLTGLAIPTSGAIRILGLPVPEQGFEIRRRIGIVPDDTLLFDHLTGFEYLQFVGRLYGLARAVAKERSQELLDLFELGSEPRKLVGEYSKGMRKRLAMSAALIHRPQLFLMDEPFEGVDAVGARLMKDILLEQVRRGATVFLTSHVLEVVERLCDRLAIINRGKVVLQGTLPELRAQAEEGAGSLEDIFVHVIGAERASSETLGWLRSP
jgi:ABC-2 type transport system ATP-binding protein